MNLFDIYKEFRRGGTILSKDFNDLQYALVGSFKKLGTERTDSKTGVDGTFSVGDPIDPENAATKGYVDVQLENNLPEKGDQGPVGPEGPQGENLSLSGAVEDYDALSELEDVKQGDVWVTNDNNNAWLFDDGIWVNIGVFGGTAGENGLPGEDGAPGEPGNMWYVDTDEAAAADELDDGDLLLNPDTGDIFSFDGELDGLVIEGNLMGPKGLKGTSGATGPSGSRGEPGPQGPAGQGYNGPNVEFGVDQEILYWAMGGWKATDAIRVTGYGIQIPYMAKDVPSFVIANEAGFLNTAVIPTSFKNMDRSFEQLESKVLELTKRLSKVEQKV